MRELQIQCCSMLRNLSKFSSFINANFSLSLNILTNQGKKYRIRSTNFLSLNLLSTWITINLHKEDFNSTIELRGFNCIRATRSRFTINFISVPMMILRGSWYPAVADAMCVTRFWMNARSPWMNGTERYYAARE